MPRTRRRSRRRSRLTEYVIEGGALWRLSTDARRRWIPFVHGGAGVARHVHEGRVLAENGVSGYAGAGALYALGIAAHAGGARGSACGSTCGCSCCRVVFADGAGVATRLVATAGAFMAF